MPGAQASNPTEPQDENKTVRLHITPLRPELLKVYLAPSVLPSAQNISYHTVETFPEKGFGYVDLPEAEAQKLKKKLNGTTLRGSKVRIEMAKSEKRKAREEADAAKENAEADRPSKRVKKEKRKKDLGVLDGVELPDDRKVKRGWTEPPSKNKKERKEKKDKKDKDKAREQKHSKYTKEPELLFKAKLTPVAAAEVAHKEKSKEKKEKKEKNKSKSREMVIHEFEKNTKTPSFLKETKVTTTKKPAVDYVNGVGWVDEDGTVVEPETGRAKHRRALELVDKPTEAQKAWIDGLALPQSSTSETKKSKKEKKDTPPPSSEEDDESSVVSSSSEDASSSESEAESEAESAVSSPQPDANGTRTPEKQQALPSEEKDVHPLEALFKRPKSTPDATSTPAKKLTPLNTSFSFFDSNEENTEVNGEPVENVPTTPFTEKDLEWRGLRSAAPTPDTAAIGRRFSFDWRKGSQEAEDDEEMEDVDPDAEQQLSQNTKANAAAKHLPGVTEEDENEDAEAGAEQQATGADEQPESEFRKWFWENRGDLNRAWKKRRRDALKVKRHTENKRMTGGRRVD
ncbi:hypothetical protein N0V83_000665 [Neocucurbitaria cava]|uniref:RRM domain-containing protein n=1 Tax=Neocucurbitaria cava TaxID=798079 RepID=A0A9W8YJU2_9PLEO|nr:hypothetical protein N0V83_000665 [Neocucurbitaria cava]